MNKKDLWGMKQPELLKMADEYKVKYDSEKINRKELIDSLLIQLAADGKLEEGVELSDSGSGPINTKGKKWILIRFHSQAGQPKYVYLGLGSRDLYLPREKVCKIPAEFMGVITNAVEERLEMTESHGGKIRYKVRKVPTLSYEVLERGEG